MTGPKFGRSDRLRRPVARCGARLSPAAAGLTASKFRTGQNLVKTLRWPRCGAASAHERVNDSSPLRWRESVQFLTRFVPWSEGAWFGTLDKKSVVSEPRDHASVHPSAYWRNRLLACCDAYHVSRTSSKFMHNVARDATRSTCFELLLAVQKLGRTGSHGTHAVMREGAALVCTWTH